MSDVRYECVAVGLQVQEVNDCPEEWMEQIIAEEEAYDHRFKKAMHRVRQRIERDAEKLFEGFDENDESWDSEK